MWNLEAEWTVLLHVYSYATCFKVTSAFTTSEPHTIFRNIMPLKESNSCSHDSDLMFTLFHIRLLDESTHTVICSYALPLWLPSISETSSQKYRNKPGKPYTISHVIITHMIPAYFLFTNTHTCMIIFPIPLSKRHSHFSKGRHALNHITLQGTADLGVGRDW